MLKEWILTFLAYRNCGAKENKLNLNCDMSGITNTRKYKQLCSLQLLFLGLYGNHDRMIIMFSCHYRNTDNC